jgi:hypothetical protein
VAQDEEPAGDRRRDRAGGHLPDRSGGTASARQVSRAPRVDLR